MHNYKLIASKLQVVILCILYICNQHFLNNVKTSIKRIKVNGIYTEVCDRKKF